MEEPKATRAPVIPQEDASSCLSSCTKNGLFHNPFPFTSYDKVGEGRSTRYLT